MSNSPITNSFCTLTSTLTHIGWNLWGFFKTAELHGIQTWQTFRYIQKKQDLKVFFFSFTFLKMFKFLFSPLGFFILVLNIYILDLKDEEPWDSNKDKISTLIFLLTLRRMQIKMSKKFSNHNKPAIAFSDQIKKPLNVTNLLFLTFRCVILLFWFNQPPMH